MLMHALFPISISKTREPYLREALFEQYALLFRTRLTSYSLTLPIIFIVFARTLVWVVHAHYSILPFPILLDLSLEPLSMAQGWKLFRECFSSQVHRFPHTYVFAKVT